MVRLLFDTTINGALHLKGAILALDGATETQLMTTGNADRNIDFSGIKTLPALVAQSYAPATRSSNNSTDTVYATITSVTMPAGTMGSNSKLVIIPEWDVMPTAGTKIAALDFGLASVSGIILSGANQNVKPLVEIENLNSLLGQKVLNGSTYQLTNSPRLAIGVDTSADVVITFKAKWGANVVGETITLLGYSIWHYPSS
jgi:hypothetical protein